MTSDKTSGPDYILKYDMGVDADRKMFKSQEIQCELLRESKIVFEDKDMQIVFPTAVAQIVVKPTEKESAC